MLVQVRRLIVLVSAAMLAFGVAHPADAAQAHAAPESWAVKAQKRLNQLGCQAGRPDGAIDKQTRTAVIRFQSRQGRKQSGRLDAATRQRLYDEQAPRCDRRPVPKRTGQGRRIVISQQQNWIWLVGPAGRVVAQGPMVDNPKVLRPGAYAVGSYCGRAARIKLNRASSGSFWLDNFVRFAPCGIGFHRIPRKMSTGKQLHADWVLGTNLSRSHGCIRLSRELSRTVWGFTTRRTPVRVV